MQTRKHQSQRGSALVVALGLTMTVLALGIAMLSMSTSEQKSTQAQGDNISMRNLAEAGIDRAFYQLNYDPTWRCANRNDANFINTPVTSNVNGKTVTLGTFTVDPIVEQGGDYIQVTAHGYYPSNKPGAQKKTIRVTAYKEWGMPFSAAAFGRSGVPLANGDTDSYDSSKGSYNSQVHGTKGDIRTDSTDPASITIYNQGHCNGKVIYGPGTNLDGVSLDRSRINDGNDNETDDIIVASSTAVMPDISVPSNAKNISEINGGSNVITGSLLIKAGTYVCDGISMAGNSTILTTGKVILYVRGNVAISGNGIVNNNDYIGGVSLPANLQIYCTPACTSVKIDGNGHLVSALYAPQADIVLNGAGSNGDVYGALAGKTVSFNGTNTVLHYDVALQSLTGVVTGFRTKTWEEN